MCDQHTPLSRVSSAPEGQTATHEYCRVYRQLDARKREIRLLTILGDDDEDSPLRCRLKTVSLNDKPIYECISYRCGDPTTTELVMVGCVQVSVTMNLASALRASRYDKDLWLWTDAISIDQQNLEERGQQIQQMGVIYSAAAKVRVWIGWPKSKGRSSSSVAEMHHAAWAFQHLCESDPSEQSLITHHMTKVAVKFIVHLAELFDDEYWSRRWILQELALAKQLTLYYGPCTYDFNIPEAFPRLGNVCIAGIMLASAMQRAGRASSIRHFLWTGPDALLKRPYRLDSLLKFIRSKTWLLASSHDVEKCLESFAVIIQKVSHVITVQRLTTKTELASIRALRGGTCTVIHDHVYSLLGVVPRTWLVSVDYERPWQDVFADFTYNILKDTADPSLLPQAMPLFNEIPSWVVDWRGSVHGESVGFAAHWRYKAAGDSSFEVARLDSMTIQVQGLVIDSVASISNVPSGMSRTGWDLDLHKLIAEYTRHCCTYKFVSEGIPMALLRTLVLDTAAGILGDPGKFDDGRLQPDRAAAWKIDVDHYLATGKTMESSEACRQIVLTLKHCTVFMTVAGRPGVATEFFAEKGDRIVILGGCGMPFVVRPRTVAGAIRYTLVGQCYVHGIMDGEALTDTLRQVQQQEPLAGLEKCFEPLLLM